MENKNTTTAMIDKETWLDLMSVRAKKGFKTIGEAISFCVNKVVGKKKIKEEAKADGKDKSG